MFQSAESKNIAIELKGKSRFLVNNIDVLDSLHTTNTTSADGGASSAETISRLVTQVSKLRSMMRGQNGILNRLEIIESGIPSNNLTVTTGPSDRSRLNALNRRIVNLELKVANLTERLTRDHCKSYPCLNGGTCFNMFETFRCECPQNWEGPTCSNDVNECSRFAGTDLGCQNGASCFNTPGSYQ